MPKIAWFSSYDQDILDFYLEYLPDGYTVESAGAQTPVESMVNMVKDADFIVLHQLELPEEVYRAGTNVKFVQLLSAGYDNINLHLLEELGIPVSNIGGVNAQGVSELTLTLILSLYRRLVQMDVGLRGGKWLKDINTGHSISELAEKTVGIVGLGNIGRMVAKRLSGFDTTLLGYDLMEPSTEEIALGIKRVSLDELLGTSDIVTLHIPLLRGTTSMISSAELAMMKPTAIIINTSRGPIIDEQALINALQNNTIAGAGLDVFATEPIDINNPLIKMDNVVLTPHAAGSTNESWPRRAKFTFGNLERVTNGQAPLSAVKPE